MGKGDRAIEITLKEASLICGKTAKTLANYCTWGINKEGASETIVLASYKRGKIRYTTLEDLHEFLLHLPPRYRDSVPLDYITPPGLEPLPDLQLVSHYGLSKVEVSHILEVNLTRINKLVLDGKLAEVIGPEGQRLIDHDSIEEHLLRVETWHYLRQYSKAKREVYGDILDKAYEIAQRHINKERSLLRRRKKRIQDAKDKRNGKDGDTKRKREKSVPRPRLGVAIEEGDEYELHD